MELQWDSGTKIYSNGPGHMTKVAAIPIYNKIINNSSSLEAKADNLECLYAALGTQVLSSMFT